MTSSLRGEGISGGPIVASVERGKRVKRREDDVGGERVPRDLNRPVTGREPGPSCGAFPSWQFDYDANR